MCAQEGRPCRGPEAQSASGLPRCREPASPGVPPSPSRSPSSGPSIWATFSRRSRVTARARRGLAVAAGAAAAALSSGCPAGPRPRRPHSRRRPGAGTASSAGPACSASSCTAPALPPPPAQRRSRRSRRRRGTGPTPRPPPLSTWRGAALPWPPRTAPPLPAASYSPRPPPPRPPPPRPPRPPPAAESWGWLRPPPGSSRAGASSWPAWGPCASWGRLSRCSSSGGRRRRRRRPIPPRPLRWCASGRGPGCPPAPLVSSLAVAVGAAAAAGRREGAPLHRGPPKPAAARARSSRRSLSAPRPPLPLPKVPQPRPAGTLCEWGAPPLRLPSSSTNAATRTVRTPVETPATALGSRPPKPQTSTSCRHPSCSRWVWATARGRALSPHPAPSSRFPLSSPSARRRGFPDSPRRPLGEWETNGRMLRACF